MNLPVIADVYLLLF